MRSRTAHRWMSEADAVRHICEVISCSKADAKQELLDAVIDGDVEARARQAEFTSANILERRGWQRTGLSLKVWQTSIIEWPEDRILISVEDEKERLVGGPLGRVVATGIELRRTDVLRLWPTEERETGTEPEPAPSKGGRPARYDWAGAAGFLAAYIAFYDPSRPDAGKALADWFSERGKAPDERTLRRAVSEAFTAYEKLARRDT